MGKYIKDSRILDEEDKKTILIFDADDTLWESSKHWRDIKIDIAHEIINVLFKNKNKIVMDYLDLAKEKLKENSEELKIDLKDYLRKHELKSFKNSIKEKILIDRIQLYIQQDDKTEYIKEFIVSLEKLVIDKYDKDSFKILIELFIIYFNFREEKNHSNKARGIDNFRTVLLEIVKELFDENDEIIWIESYVNKKIHELESIRYTAKDGVRSALSILKKTHHLAILSQGSPYEINSKLKTSGLNVFFDNNNIVLDFNKNSDFKELKNEIPHTKEIFYIGNSLKNDILPAFKAGFRTIFYPNSNTWINDDVVDNENFTDIKTYLIRTPMEIMSIVNIKNEEKLKKLLKYDSHTKTIKYLENGKTNEITIYNFCTQKGLIFCIGDFIHEMFVIPKSIAYESVRRHSEIHRGTENDILPIQQYGGAMLSQSLLNVLNTGENEYIVKSPPCIDVNQAERLYPWQTGTVIDKENKDRLYNQQIFYLKKNQFNDNLIENGSTFRVETLLTRTYAEDIYARLYKCIKNHNDKGKLETKLSDFFDNESSMNSILNKCNNDLCIHSCERNSAEHNKNGLIEKLSRELSDRSEGKTQDGILFNIFKKNFSCYHYKNCDDQLEDISSLYSNNENSYLVIDYFSDQNRNKNKDNIAIKKLFENKEINNFNTIFIKCNDPIEAITLSYKIDNIWIIGNITNLFNKSGTHYYSWEALIEAVIKELETYENGSIIKVENCFNLVLLCKNEGCIYIEKKRNENTFHMHTFIDPFNQYGTFSASNYGWVAGFQNIFITKFVHSFVSEKSIDHVNSVGDAWKYARAVFLLGYGSIELIENNEIDKIPSLIPVAENLKTVKEIMTKCDEELTDFEKKFRDYVQDVLQYSVNVDMKRDDQMFQQEGNEGKVYHYSKNFSLLCKYRLSLKQAFIISEKIIELGPDALNNDIYFEPGKEPDKKISFRIPFLKIGNHISIFRKEIEEVNLIYTVIRDYVKRKTTKRPLSIAVFGEPGSGKSFTVTQIVKNLQGVKSEILEFNLSQMYSLNDLMEAFHLIQDAGQRDRLPVVFWDEFDCEFNENIFGWLKNFLAPMQDGMYLKDGKDHYFGQAIFIFAGGICSNDIVFKALRVAKQDVNKYLADTYQDIDGEILEQYAREATSILKDINSTKIKTLKLPDFISRLKLTYTVPTSRISDLNKKIFNTSENINDTKLEGKEAAIIFRRASLIRNQLASHAGHLKTMDFKAFHRLLLSDRYACARDLESAIEASTLADVENFGLSALPLSQESDNEIKLNKLVIDYGKKEITLNNLNRT